MGDMGARWWVSGVPALLRRQTHHTSADGEVTPGGAPAPIAGGVPIMGQALHPVPTPRLGQGGSGAGSRPSAGVPSACSCAGSARTTSAPAQGSAGAAGGDTRGRGDLSQRRPLNRFPTPPWAGGGHPEVLVSPTPRRHLVLQGDGGCSSPVGGCPQRGDTGSPRGLGDTHGAAGPRLAGPLFGTSRPPLGIGERLCTGPEMKQYVGKGWGRGGGKSPAPRPLPWAKGRAGRWELELDPAGALPLCSLGHSQGDELRPVPASAGRFGRGKPGRSPEAPAQPVGPVPRCEGEHTLGHPRGDVTK